MDRRGFVKICAGSAALALSGLGREVLAGDYETFPPARLTDGQGNPLKASAIPSGEAMVFSYPLAGVPCFLVNLGERPAGAGTALENEEGGYTWTGGVGPKANIVAFVAICTHQLSYPQPEISYLRYAAAGSEIAGGPGKIVCCAHASVFDPAAGAQVVSGPATMPLLPVRLAHDASTDELAADGIMGMAFIQRFFKTYRADLNSRYGPGGYRQAVGGTTACIPLSQYSGIVPAC
ncbi:MAG: Rieske (2Fe-2S) protein [Pseudomonadota bacterium]